MQETLQRILEEYRQNEGNLITILQSLEDAFGYIPQDAVDWFSEQLDIPPAKFFGVATFYAQFHLTPRGRNIITACCGTACHVKGAERIINSLTRERQIPSGEDTTEDKEFTVEKVNCVGACSIAPVVIINKEVHGKMTPERLMKELKRLKKGK